MASRLTLRATITLVGIAATYACAGRRTEASGALPITPDSLRGIVSVVGTTYERSIALTSSGRVTLLVASAPDSAALARLGAVEIVVRGRSDGSTFRVVSFQAERVDGAPVVDGVLALDGEKLVLTTSAGHVALGNPPAAFRAMIGARVWVGGPLDTGPNNYGVIVPVK